MASSLEAWVRDEGQGGGRRWLRTCRGCACVQRLWSLSSVCGHGQFLPAYPTLEPQLAQSGISKHMRAHTPFSSDFYIAFSRTHVYNWGLSVWTLGGWEGGTNQLCTGLLGQSPPLWHSLVLRPVPRGLRPAGSLGMSPGLACGLAPFRVSPV